MITIQTEDAYRFTNRDQTDRAYQQAEQAYRQLQAGTGRGSEWLGWRRILERPDSSGLARIEESAARICESADVFIVCGIGGSYLGAKAVIEALRGHHAMDKPEILFAGHHLGGKYLRQLIHYLEEPNGIGEPKSVYLNVISKSGSTLETALAFRILRIWLESRYGDQASERILATTGPEGGVLNTMIQKQEYKKFVIPEDVGGRFSVLTPVGLLPVAVAGIDIQELFQGSAEAFRTYEKSAHDLLEYAALRTCFFQYEGKALDVIASFEPEMNAFAGWIQQLLGESEGKEGKGLFPVPAAYTTDLHSIGQMVQQGKRNMIETLLVVEKDFSGLVVPGGDRQAESGGKTGDRGPESGGESDGLGYLSGRPLHEINRQALNGTIEAHVKGGVPVIQVILQALDERNLGALIYFYELFTAVYVYMLELNPFDQPGVEDYKKAMYRKLGKE